MSAPEGYGAGARLLHRLALGNRAVAEMAFDIDQALAKPDLDAAAGGRHVFVAGLARAGTTALMRALHGSGEFRSLTYRDMPFVLAPTLWRRLGGGRGAAGALAERAHGDGIAVNADSPEAFDEVFWRVFDSASYMRPAGLVPHAPGPDLRAKFVAYVGAVLRAGGAPRYLSKNNANILRLPALAEMFPEALILIPFREPRAHAASLLRQHRRFSAVQAETPFVRHYMDWLGHREFGLGHLPFRVPGAEPGGDPESLDYWLAQWLAVYGWLERTAPERAVWVCYEDLCTDAGAWARIAALAGVAGGSGAGFRLSGSGAQPGDGTGLAEAAGALYLRLRGRVTPPAVPAR